MQEKGSNKMFGGTESKQPVPEPAKTKEAAKEATKSGDKGERKVPGK